MKLTDEQIEQVRYVVDFNTHKLPDKEDIRQFFWVRFMPQLKRWDSGRGKLTSFAKAVVRSSVKDYIQMAQRQGFSFKCRTGGERDIPERTKYGRPLPAGHATCAEAYSENMLPKSEARRRQEKSVSQD